MFDARKYYDGIPPKVEEHNSNLSLEELEAEIEIEKKKCDKMKSWDDIDY